MGEIEILAEYPEAVVCVKPAGLLSQSGKPGQESMISLLSRQLGSEIYPVHRLDRETGGVMVYARQTAAVETLSRRLREGRKEYLAVLPGSPSAREGRLTDLLYHDVRRNKTYVVQRKRKGVREAELYYRVLAEAGDRTLVQVRLLTGRTHQIRVQFASRGLPLEGDGRYGGGSGSVQLWSMRLSAALPGQAYRDYVRLPPKLGPFCALSLPDPICVEDDGERPDAAVSRMQTGCE